MKFLPDNKAKKKVEEPSKDEHLDHNAKHDSSERHKIFRKYPYNLKDLTEEDWDYIHRHRGEVLFDKVYTLDQGLKFPGFIADTSVETEDYYSWWNHYFGSDLDLVSPRGNLGSKYRINNCPVIVCGIAPGCSDLSRHEPKWLLGPSSKLLHKILYCAEVLPYFTNIYKQPADRNNTGAISESELAASLRVLGQEIDILCDSVWKKADKVFLITLGKYKEYSEILSRVKTSKLIQSVSLYHPSYFLRNGATTIENSMIKKEIEKVRRLFND